MEKKNREKNLMGKTDMRQRKVRDASLKQEKGKRSSFPPPASTSSPTTTQTHTRTQTLLPPSSRTLPNPL
jgi:hypothetical protein